MSLPTSLALQISIHALREEGDAGHPAQASIRSDFNPRPPRGGRHDSSCAGTWLLIFQSTPSARRATRRRYRPERPCSDFNPRPPRGGRPRLCAFCSSGQRFQSTPSARRATYCSNRLRSNSENFNPRPPRGGRPGKAHWCRQKRRISIHALREEGDPATRPAMPLHLQISIHALREEGDDFVHVHAVTVHQFQSTPSARRATVVRSVLSLGRSLFQSTPSARRATLARAHNGKL